MKKLVSICFLILISFTAWTKPIPVKSKHTVIIDTDCAIDDLRAISLLLSRPEITIKAILLSDGSLSPIDGYSKVKALLHEFKFDSIPVGYGEALKGINPPWRPFVRSISWGEYQDRTNPGIDATTLLNEKLSQSTEKIVIVCLGALTNISKLIKKDASVISRIERIIWYNESVKPLQGFNYECDKSAADVVLKSGVRIDVISNLKKNEAIIDTDFYNLYKNSNTSLSQTLYKVHSQPAVFERLNQNHFRLCDDLLPVYITNPELFDINTLKENFKIRYNQDYDVASVKEVMKDMIMGTYVVGKSIVFSEFPQKKEMFTYDVRQIMDTAIARYGTEEWKANVLTDEFHGHLGVFSIVGAKMGIKARELFGVAPDMIEVTTFAGSKPPYSCLNDGIQVSTGATLGMGTIHLSTDSFTRPSAIFTFKGKSIQLTLKSEYLKRVDDDINEGIVKFGLMDDGYWKLIRRNAIVYWLNWDRNKIFDIKELN